MTSDELSHPEILSPEKLREILCSRGLLPKDLKDKEKDELVKLCHRFVVPLPQRDKQLRRARRKETMRLPRDRVSTGTKRYFCNNSTSTRAQKKFHFISSGKACRMKQKVKSRMNQTKEE